MSKKDKIKWAGIIVAVLMVLYPPRDSLFCEIGDPNTLPHEYESCTKYGEFLFEDSRKINFEWLFWQLAGVGLITGYAMRRTSKKD